MSDSPAGIPPKRPTNAYYPDGLKDRYPREVIDKLIHLLGSVIGHTIEAHMKRTGVFTDSDYVETAPFYRELFNVIGPGAEMFLGELRTKS